jgi:hypothetical protein
MAWFALDRTVMAKAALRGVIDRALYGVRGNVVWHRASRRDRSAPTARHLLVAAGPRRCHHLLTSAAAPMSDERGSTQTRPAPLESDDALQLAQQTDTDVLRRNDPSPQEYVPLELQ